MAGPDATARFLDAAAHLAVTVDIVRYPEGTRTAADAAAAVGCVVDQIVKSLVFMADDGPVLVLTAGSNRVDEDRLARHVGAATVRLGSADEVRSVTGFAIGGTPPFGHLQPIPTVIDPHLLDFDEVYAAAGTPDSVFAVAPSALAVATEAVAAAVIADPASPDRQAG